MAVLDYLLEFSDAQALTSITNGSVTKSTNQSDLQSGDLDAWGTSVLTNRFNKDVTLNVGVSVALVGTSAALEVQLVSKAANVSISSGATVHGVVRIPAVSAAGYKTSISVPAQAFNRYLGVLYCARGATLTSATVNCWLGIGDGEIHD